MKANIRDFIIKDLEIFGSLENMTCIVPMADNTAIDFRKRGILFNIDTRIICKINTRKVKQGGFNYSFVLTYTECLSGKVKQIKSIKYHTKQSLIDGIITEQKQIIV